MNISTSWKTFISFFFWFLNFYKRFAVIRKFLTCFQTLHLLRFFFKSCGSFLLFENLPLLSKLSTSTYIETFHSNPLSWKSFDYWNDKISKWFGYIGILRGILSLCLRQAQAELLPAQATKFTCRRQNSLLSILTPLRFSTDSKSSIFGIKIPFSRSRTHLLLLIVS